MTADSPAPPARRRWPFRPWETAVIVLAVVLFILAAFAGPRGGPAPPLVAPSPSASLSATPDPLGSASPSASASPDIPIPQPTGSPVASVDQILASDVGQYTLVDRGLSESGAQGGALQSAELRYSLSPASAETDVFHAVEIHASSEVAQERVRTFGDALSSTGFTRVREQPLRNADDEVQGYFIALRGQGQRLLLWSNQNVTFSLGGGEDADVDAFYEALPY